MNYYRSLVQIEFSKRIDLEGHAKLVHFSSSAVVELLNLLERGAVSRSAALWSWPGTTGANLTAIVFVEQQLTAFVLARVRLVCRIAFRIHKMQDSKYEYCYRFFWLPPNTARSCPSSSQTTS